MVYDNNNNKRNKSKSNGENKKCQNPKASKRLNQTNMQITPMYHGCCIHQLSSISFFIYSFIYFYYSPYYYDDRRI